MSFFGSTRKKILFPLLLVMSVSSCFSQNVEETLSMRLCWANTGDKMRDVSPLVIGQTIIFAFEKKIAAIGKDGILIWQTDINGNTTNLKASDLGIIIRLEDQLDKTKFSEITIDKTTGLPTRSLATSTKIETEKTLSVTDLSSFVTKNQSVSFIDQRTGKEVWKFKAGAKITSLAKSEKGILLSSWDNFLYLLDKISGRIIWKKRFPQRLNAKPFVATDFVIAGADFGNYAEIISLANGRSLTRLDFPNDNEYFLTPILIDKLFIFPTNKGILAYSNQCK